MAAGLGFKTFNTGDVLSAADVNGYLMQGILVFASATARDAAITSPQEGQFAFLKDTNVTTYYTGSVWANVDSTGMTNPMTTTGDVIYSSSGSTPARLGLGTAGQVLQVNSGATAPEWAAPSSGAESLGFTAGKNKFINGDMNIWQRGTSFTTSEYTADRWRSVTSPVGTIAVTRETFTPGTAPVAGYESAYFMRFVTAGQSGATAISLIRQAVEDVRTFAGQTVTLSFWAKAGSGTPSIALSVAQLFGTGGSPSATAEAPAGKVQISTSWARYSFTYAVPSIAGKTIGTDVNSSNTRYQLFVSAGTDYATASSSLGVQNNTFDIWGVQLEPGSTATAFQTATGTLQGELAACQRYFQRLVNGADDAGESVMVAQTTGATAGYGYKQFLVPMRVAPTFSNSAASNFNGKATGGSNVALTSFSYSSITTRSAIVIFASASGFTAGAASLILAGSASATMDASAEL
jgi:hypothetical protein